MEKGRLSTFVMKAQELRIGNYVSDLHASERFFAPVIKIDVTRCYYGSYHSSYSDLKPIPLTEQWLIDFGFERGVDYWFKGDVILDISPEGLSYRFHYNIILHVHQLQNLYFALTGEELQL